MSGVNVLIFTDNTHSRLNENMNVYLRGSGSYRIATEIRRAGYTCQVVDFLSILTKTDIKNIIDKFVGSDTYILGFGNTFFERSSDRGFNEELSMDEYILDRTKIRREVHFSVSSNTLEHLRRSRFPFDENLIKTFFIDYAKLKNSKIKIVLGGPVAPNILSKDFIDIFISGFSDYSIIECIEAIRNNEPLNKFYNEVNNEKFNFNTSKILWDTNDFIFKEEPLSIELSRGCIFDCKFCNFHLRGKKKFDYIKEPEIIYEEFIRNYELYGTTHYSFAEDTFNDSTYKLELLFNKVINRLPFKIKFGAFLRLDLINAHREQIQLLKDMGIKTCIFGIESINPISLKNIGKTLTKDKMENILTILKQEWPESTTLGSFIYGLPGDTKKTLKEYEKWLMDDALNYLSGCFIVPLQIHKYGTSEISKNYKVYGYDFINDSNFIWKSDSIGITFLDAMEITRNIQYHLINDDRYRFSGHLSLASNRFGLTDEMVLKTPIKNLNLNNITTQYKNILNEYKSKLLT